MHILPSSKSILFVAVAAFLLALAPACHAQSLDRHDRKIEKRLAKYPPGTLLQVDLRDDSEALGALGILANESFQITNSDNNRRMTISYADVASVKPCKEFIGEGSETGHHFRLWVPVVVGSAVAAAAFATVAVVH